MEVSAPALHQWFSGCGLMLVLQLVAGEDHKPEIFTGYHRCDDTFHFDIIQKKIMKKIPAVDAAFTTI